ncbi:MAG: rRNA maturation RNase YbeY [Acidiferrobacterales bacterium]|jgi:probable rRNA maturation factor|nr:rRNA maturation RNase YbeY [Acidiferrobacterales bacterium]
MELTVQDVSGYDGIPDDATIAVWITAAIGVKDVSITVRIVDEVEMAELNQQYRHKAGATNVLSFPFENPPGVESNILGDIVVCAPVVDREAREQDKTLLSHWAHMVIHGVLHLQGYDHETDEQAAEMEQLETGILSDLGFPAPYAVA